MIWEVAVDKNSLITEVLEEQILRDCGEKGSCPVNPAPPPGSVWKGGGFRCRIPVVRTSFRCEGKPARVSVLSGVESALSSTL